MPGRSRILLTGSYVMPDRTPAALRAIGLAKSLRDAGWKCEFGAAEVWQDGKWAAAGTRSTIDGFPVSALGEYGGSASTRAIRAAHPLVLAGWRARKWIAEGDLTDVAAVISMGGYTPAMLRLLPLLRAKGVPIVADIVDWFDPWHLPGGPFTPYYWQIELAMRWLYKLCAGLLVVSRFLERYYARAGTPVLRVPPTTDSRSHKWGGAELSSERNGGGLRLVYAGSPGQKDDLSIFVAAALRTHSSIDGLKLTFVGPTREAVERLLPARLRRGLGALDVHFSGFLRHEEVPAHLAENDFSVLIRPSKRYANAGFPTKLVESLSAGVPMIVNDTSDILEYVQDGREGFIVDQFSEEALAATIVRAARTGPRERREMRIAAKERAAASFDFRNHTAALSEFVDVVIARARDAHR